MNEETLYVGKVDSKETIARPSAHLSLSSSQPGGCVNKRPNQIFKEAECSFRPSFLCQNPREKYLGISRNRENYDAGNTRSRVTNVYFTPYAEHNLALTPQRLDCW